MKYFIHLSALAAVLSSCSPAADYKSERDGVMKYHDVVMQDHDVLVNQQIRIDTVLKSMPALKKQFPELDTVQEKQALEQMTLRLNKARNRMNVWMQEFEPDVSGKSNTQAVQYFKAEKKKIAGIDSSYKAEIKSAAALLGHYTR